MSEKAIVLAQEIFFDICDAIEGRFFETGKFPQEFKNAREWLEEQKQKIEKIESLIEG